MNTGHGPIPSRSCRLSWAGVQRGASRGARHRHAPPPTDRPHSVTAPHRPPDPDFGTGSPAAPDSRSCRWWPSPWPARGGGRVGGHHRDGDPGLRIPRPHLLGASPLPSRALYGWGGNSAGQVGNGALGAGVATGVTAPVQSTLHPGRRFASVAAGGAFTVGLTTSGQVYAWGAGSLGQLGDGTTAGSTVPMPVTVPSGGRVRRPSSPRWRPAMPTHWPSPPPARSTPGGPTSSASWASAPPRRPTSPRSVAAPAGTTFTAISAGGDHSLAVDLDRPGVRLGGQHPRPARRRHDDQP